MIDSVITGLVLGVITGFTSTFFLGVWLVNLFKISTFEGGSGFAVLKIMMIGMPVVAGVFALTNGLLAPARWA